MQHDLLAWDSPDGDPTLWPTLRGEILRVSPRMVSSDIHMLRGCAANGMGIAFLPDPGPSAPGPPPDGLVHVLGDEVGRERSLTAVVPAVLSEIPRIRAVLDEARAFVQAMRPP